MFQNKHKNIIIKIVTCCMIMVLTLSSFGITRASAAEEYFTAESDILALSDLDPSDPDERIVTVWLKAAREMTLHSLEGYFTPVSSEDEELGYGFGDIDADFPGMDGIRYSLEDGWFEWIAEDLMSEGESSEGIHVQAGDSIARINYLVKPDVEVLRRSMPVKVELAVIDEGGETGKRVGNETMEVYVVAGRDVSVYKQINGNGVLDVSDIVIGGTEIEVGIVPDDGNELTYLELNDQDVTDQVENGVFRMIVDNTEPLYFFAMFQRIYPVLEGDGGEHVLGSEESLAFKIDNEEVVNFCERGVLFIDDDFVDMEEYCEVDSENQAIVLSAAFLNTLELGEHSFDAWFSEPESGYARASFKIIEEREEDEGDNEDVPVPDTGVFTGEGGNAELTNGVALAFAVVVCIFAIAGFAVKRTKE